MLRSSSIYLFASILILSIFFVATPIIAQTPQDIINGIQNNIQAEVIPQYPKAGDTVTINLTSYGTDLRGATISWIVNGKIQKKGVGVITFSTTVGKIGSSFTITARVSTVEGAVVERIVRIEPTDIDLVWQVDSYTPPFYEGKALYPHQGLITFTAIPNTSSTKSVTASMNNLVYTWIKDGEVLGDYSGYGKNTFTLRGSVISRAFTMTVQVSKTDGTTVGSAAVSVKPISPQISFYENSPLLGVLYNKQLSSFVMPRSEMVLAAVPYYFDTQAENPSLKYTWNINGSTIATNQDNPNFLTIRQQPNQSGIVSIGVKIENLRKTLQFNAKDIKITLPNNQPNL